MDEETKLQFIKMIEQEEESRKAALSIASLYNNLLACGLSEAIAADFVNTILKTSFGGSNVR